MRPPSSTPALSGQSTCQTCPSRAGRAEVTPPDRDPVGRAPRASYDETMTGQGRRAPGGVAMAALIDALLVAVFVVIGRRSHAEGLDLAGIAGTAWPFLVALVAGWLLAVAWRRPFAPWPTGVVVWGVTVSGGMLLRLVSGQGTQLAFVIVAAVTLAGFLIGWRLVALLVTRRSRGLSADRSESAS